MWKHFIYLYRRNCADPELIYLCINSFSFAPCFHLCQPRRWTSWAPCLYYRKDPSSEAAAFIIPQENKTTIYIMLLMCCFQHFVLTRNKSPPFMSEETSKNNEDCEMLLTLILMPPRTGWGRKIQLTEQNECLRIYNVPTVFTAFGNVI